MLDQTNESFMK